jgi:hypothetical protein
MLDLHGDLELSLMLLQVHVVQSALSAIFCWFLRLTSFFVDLAFELVEVFLQLRLLRPTHLIIRGPLTLTRGISSRLLI